MYIFISLNIKYNILFWTTLCFLLDKIKLQGLSPEMNLFFKSQNIKIVK